MAEETVKVGDIVFAGDLVKVQHGTKYNNITYFDFGDTIIDSHRQYYGFDMNQSLVSSFLYWQTENGNILAGEIYDGGLEHDVSAYAHVSSEVLVTYFGNGAFNVGSEIYVDINGKLSNEIFLAEISGEAIVDRTYVEYKLRENMFEPIIEGNKTRYRLYCWKENNAGKAFYPDDIVKINKDTNFYAQWIKVEYLNLNSASNGKAGLLIQPYEQIADQHVLDNGTVIIVRAQPNDHYHLTKWKLQAEKDTIDIQITAYDPYCPPDISKYDLITIMSSDLTVTPTYSIDQNVISLNVISSNLGKIEVTYDDTKRTVIERDSIICDYGSTIMIYALPNDIFSKFAYWSGDIDEKNINSQYLYFKSIDQTKTLNANFSELDKYSVTTILSMKNAGKIVHVNINSVFDQNVYYPEGMEVKLQAQLEHGYKIVAWEIDNVMQQTSQGQIVVTSSISKNHVVKLHVDALLVDNFDVPIVDADGQPINY